MTWRNKGYTQHPNVSPYMHISKDLTPFVAHDWCLTTILCSKRVLLPSYMAISLYLVQFVNFR